MADEITLEVLQDQIRALHDDLHEIVTKVLSVQGRMDQLVASHNEVGQNVAWIVANTQGLFQMFSDPKLINQVMGGMLGGMGGAFGGGQQQPEPES
jgi:hypothetical protein